MTGYAPDPCAEKGAPFTGDCVGTTGPVGERGNTGVIDGAAGGIGVTGALLFATVGADCEDGNNDGGELRNVGVLGSLISLPEGGFATLSPGSE